MEALGAGDAFDGPAIVAGVDSTCLVLPGQRADVDPAGNLVIRER
jgi:N-methylhydantoinase A